MGAFVGSALAVQWVTATWGTLDLAVDFRSFNYTESSNFIEETAGAATSQEWILSFRAGNASWGGVMQAGSLPLYGSALSAGNDGTLRWAPEGTAAGKYHGTVRAYSQGLVHNYAYNGIPEVTCSWIQNGARTEGTAAPATAW